VCIQLPFNTTLEHAVTNPINTLKGDQLQSRRGLLMGAAAVATVAVAASLLHSYIVGPSRGVEARKQRGPRKSVAKVTPEELMKPGPLPELSVGQANAPVTIVEYADLTCGACANFHNNVLPVLKEKYIDTGKVRLVFREFPLNERSAYAFMAARCAGGERTLPLISALFSKQDDWALAKTGKEFMPKLFGFAQQAGLSKQAFDTCQRNEKLIKDIVAIRDRAHQSFGVNQTPTFFINGRKLEGGTIEDFEKALAPLLKS